MAWSTPGKFIPLEVVTADMLNTFLRDNLVETMPGKATDAGEGSLFFSQGAHNIAERKPRSAFVSTSNTLSTHNQYLDLATFGPSLTLTTGAFALVVITAFINPGAGSAISRVGVQISGATTLNDPNLMHSRALMSQGPNTTQASYVGLFPMTPGTNTFTLKYFTTAGTAQFFNREICVIPL